MRRLRVLRKADGFDDIDLRLETCEPPERGPDELLIEVRAAGVNRSDVAATMGRMPQAVWPRTPGRDWAGVVIEGPARTDRPGGVRRRRRPGHHARRHPCQPSGGASRRRGGEARDADAGGGRRTRRAVRHGAAGVSSHRHAETRRCGAGDGGERPGRPGRGADRVDARRARVRRDASRGGVRAAALRGAHDRWIERRYRGGGARGDRRPRRRHCLQHGGQPVLRRGEPGDGAWRPSDPDIDGRAAGAVRHLHLLPRPAHASSASTRWRWMRALRPRCCASWWQGLPADSSGRFRWWKVPAIRWSGRSMRIGPCIRSRGIGWCWCRDRAVRQLPVTAMAGLVPAIPSGRVPRPMAGTSPAITVKVIPKANRVSC